MVGGTRPFVPEILGQLTPFEQKRGYQSIFACSSSADTEHIRTERYHMPPKGAQKRKTAIFRLKLHFYGRKSATKFLRVKTASCNAFICLFIRAK